MNRNTSQHESRQRAGAYLAARATAGVAAALVAVVCVLLLVDHGRREWDDPFDSPEFIALKTQLAETPQNEALKEESRVRGEFSLLVGGKKKD